MKKLLCKKICLRINILALILVLLFVLTVVLFFHYQMAQNLYYQLMRPSWVDSAYVRVEGDEYAELDRAEIAQLVDILNDVTIRDGIRAYYPTLYKSYANFRISFHNGKTLYINIHFVDRLVLNEYEYPDHKTSQKLLDLYHALRQPHLEQEALS